MASHFGLMLLAGSLAFISCAHAFTAPLVVPRLAASSPVALKSGYASLVGLRPALRVSLEQHSRRQDTLALRMKDDEWSTVKVKSNSEAADGLKSIMVDVSADIFSSYKTPGQYVKIRKDSSQEKPGFFAIASAPGAGSNSLEFLIKKTDGSAWIADAAKDSTVEMTVAQGNGYKYAEALGDDVSSVILLATGSGIAPLKAVVESGDLKSKSPKLYYGARNQAQMAFQDKFKDWEAKGVEVIPVLSQPEGSWEGKKGYIQDCLKEDMKDGSKAAALLCGVNDMVKSAKEVLKDAGVSDSNVLMNF